MATKAKKCPKKRCKSKNIEIGEGRPVKVPASGHFYAGDLVKFRGLKYKSKTFLPFEGKMKAVNNAVKGAVTIVKEPKKLVFNADGTLYCHAHLGVLLEKPKVKKVEKPKKGETDDK